MIGEIRKWITPYYDMKERKKSFKSRPGLVIAQADSEDYVVLPISKVSDSRKIHSEYDVKIDPASYPSLGLKMVSYVRTHKQTTVHRAEIGDKISDMKSSCEELYLEILAKREQFSLEITNQAM